MKRQGLFAIAALGGVLAGCSGGGGGGYGGGDDTPAPPTAPTVSLTVAPATIGLGQSATLTWSSNAGTSCEASDGWSGTRQPSDAAEVVPTATGAVTYTITCSGAGFSASAVRSVTLNVEAPSVYTVTSLVEDFVGGTARTTDSHLVNPWGLAFGPTTATWVTNNRDDSATIYDGNGRPSPIVVHFAPSAAGASFEATGIVFNGTPDFAVSRAGQTAAALFIFAGEGGMIAGWAPALDVANAITMYTAADGAAYKGLAVASNGTGKFLYAADFANAKVDVFDTAFVKQAATTFAFTDPALPAGYAPFGIQAVDVGGTTRIYVSYAMRSDFEPEQEAPGPGLGLVDVFDTSGNLVERLVDEGGKLNAPWGMALAPADFGTLSNALLVGNFGDGAINGYDPTSGRFLGAVSDASGAPFAAPGLWGITFGNDAVNQPHAALFFAAGINGEANGRYGRIDLGATAPALGEFPQVTLVVLQGDLSGTVTLTANAQNLVAITKVQFFVNGTLIGTATSEPFSVEWNTTQVSNGSARVRAVATDANGNVGSSGVLTVSVANTATPATTLTQLQQTLFSPRCAGCHNGSQPPGGGLPGSLDLRAGSSFASLVAVPSLERPLARVAPGEPESSYVIHKLEGAPDISGARMPFGGPFLDQAAIDEVKSWIAAGAPNN
jgi:uncharacterized protein (TIGR03118 family)